MIKYSVMLSGLLGLQNVKNIFISKQVFCTKFVIILILNPTKTLNINTRTIRDPNINKTAASPPASLKTLLEPAKVRKLLKVC